MFDLVSCGPRRTRTGKRMGHPGLNPHPGLSLALDLLCERSADTWWNFGHEWKKKRSCELRARPTSFRRGAANGTWRWHFHLCSGVGRCGQSCAANHMTGLLGSRSAVHEPFPRGSCPGEGTGARGPIVHCAPGIVDQP